MAAARCEPAAWREPAARRRLQYRRHAANLLLVGRPGTGKSTIQRTIITRALQTDRWHVLGIDQKTVGLSWASNLPRVDAIATDRPSTADLLERVTADMHERYDTMALAGVSHVLALPEPLASLLLVVDELPRTLDGELLPLLVGLARQGSPVGIHLVLATQSVHELAGRAVWSGLVGLFDAKVVTGYLDRAYSRLVLGSDAASSTPSSPRGWGVLSQGQVTSPFRADHQPA